MRLERRLLPSIRLSRQLPGRLQNNDFRKLLKSTSRRIQSKNLLSIFAIRFVFILRHRFGPFPPYKAGSTASPLKFTRDLRDQSWQAIFSVPNFLILCIRFVSTY